jgi:hypothetical protein
VSDKTPAKNPADNANDLQRALQAVQTALDRRDNGGAAGTQEDQPRAANRPGRPVPARRR